MAEKNTISNSDESRLIIVDAGSTKTHAEILSRTRNEITGCLNMEAVNPVHLSDEELLRRLSPLSEVAVEGDSVAFFGAGCMAGEPKQRVEDALRKVGAFSSIEVESDIVAAGLSLFGNRKGIACILGTGSNVALFDNGKVVKSVPSMGYIIGDEGSGSALGRRLLRGVFRRELSIEICDAFEAETSQSLADVIENVYRRPTPNRYLAEFTYFLARHFDNFEINNLVIDEFRSLFSNQILINPEFDSIPIGFVGSVAKVFEDALRYVAVKCDFKVKKIYDSPMKGLIKYYKSKNNAK